ncbi:MAG: DnaJ domain-containing protein [Nitrospinales bacterium]
MSLLGRLGKIVRSQVESLREEKFNSDSSHNKERTRYKKSSEHYSPPATDTGDSKEQVYLANLELEKFTSMDEVKKAHRRLMKKYHPDLHAGDKDKEAYAEKICSQLNVAYDYFEDKYR